MRKLLVITILAITLLVIKPSLSQRKNAIGIRIMPNPEHLPVSIWYEKQDFIKKGSPKALVIDGYGAIQDGNTVYVNAANIIHPEALGFYYREQGVGFIPSDDPTDNKNFYTNIYVISYGEQEDEETQAIFNQIINNWKFNTNIADETLKQDLRNDTRRLGDMAYVQWLLEKYQSAYKKYPSLSAGSYIASETTSKWPSWQETLGKVIGVTLPVDPVNSFGSCPQVNPDCYCPGHEWQTCWYDKTRKFNGEDSVKEGLENMDSALVYYYRAFDNGISYELNANNFESQYLSGQYILELQSKYTAGNTPPIIDEINAENILKMSPDSTITIEMRAFDYDLDESLIWDMNFSGGNCFKNPPSLTYTSRPDSWVSSRNRYESTRNLTIEGNNLLDACDGSIDLKVTDKGGKEDIYSFDVIVKNFPPYITGLSNNTGVVAYEFLGEILVQDSPNDTFVFTWSGNKPPGLVLDGNKIKGIPTKTDTYNFTLAATDNFGASSPNYSAQIKIINRPPNITTPNNDSIFGDEWIFYVEANDDSLYSEIDGKPYPHLPLSFSLINPPSWLSLEKIEDKKAKISGIPSDVGEYKFAISVRDNYGAVKNQNFTLSFANNAPQIIDWPRATLKYRDEKFTYQIEARDEDLNKLTYTLEGIPDSVLVIDAETGYISTPGNAFDMGDYGDYTVEVSADDGYGGIDKKSFSLKINTFCGNGGEPEPGEDCDGLGGVANTAAESSLEKQYSCTDDCVFEGGYCGDNILQDGTDGTLDREKCETGINIATSATDSSEEKQYGCTACMPSGGYCGNDNIEGPEICDGSDGVALSAKDSSQTFQYSCSGECVPAGGWCGDGIINGVNMEKCDCGGHTCNATQLDSQDCTNFEFDAGVLNCYDNCTFNTADCYTAGTFNGNIKEALTSKNMSDVTVSIQYQNGTEVVSDVTGSDGNFTIEYVRHYNDYKVIISKSGYKTGGIAHLDFNSDETVQFYMLPANWAGLFAIILRWNGPRDMDSHMKFGNAHLYYVVKKINGSVLDLDDTSRNGQETITINAAEEGLNYHYYVYSYRKDSFDSSVRVQLFNNEAMLIREFIAKKDDHDTWDLFNFIPSEGGDSLSLIDNYR